MKIIAFGDIEKTEYLEKLLKLDFSKYDFILLTGDYSATSEGWKIGRARGMNDKNFIPKGKEPKQYYEELKQPLIEKFKKVNKVLGKIKKNTKVFGIYGNADFESVVNKVKVKNIEIIHNRVVEIGTFYLVGYNGHPMYPWEIKHPQNKDIFGFTYQEIAKDLHSFKEEQIYSDLKKVIKNIPSERLILVTHTPPYKILDKVLPKMTDWALKSYGEKSREGNIGSSGLRYFILEYEPLLSVFGHIHEGKGIKKIDGTTCINVGKFGENKEFMHIEIQNKELKCEFRRIN